MCNRRENDPSAPRSPWRAARSARRRPRGGASRAEPGVLALCKRPGRRAWCVRRAGRPKEGGMSGARGGSGGGSEGKKRKLAERMGAQDTSRAGNRAGGEKDQFGFDDNDVIWEGEEPSRLSGKATMHRNHGQDAGRFARRAARGRIGQIAKRQKCYLHSCRAPAAKVRDDQA